MNGYEVLVILRKRWPEIKVVMLTMHSGCSNVIYAIREGACAIVFKDSDIETFVQILINVHENGIDLSNLDTKEVQKLLKNDNVPNLTEKEMTFLVLCCQDLNYKVIADQMNVTTRSVDGYRDSLFRKLKVNTRAGLIMQAIQKGLVHI